MAPSVPHCVSANATHTHACPAHDRSFAQPHTNTHWYVAPAVVSLSVAHATVMQRVVKMIRHGHAGMYLRNGMCGFGVKGAAGFLC